MIKAGTSILTSAHGRVSRSAVERLGRNVLSVLPGRRLVLVSSGAIAFGMAAYGLKRRPHRLAHLQACAAVGQGRLMHAYEQFFSRKGVVTAQILLTRDGLEDRKRFLAARHTFEHLFRMDALPIVNENDTVATEEIAFSDNDILSVHVAHLVQAGLLILLSDVDGFYLKDGTRIRQVTSLREIDEELPRHLEDSRKEKTVGGMKAKLAAARTAAGLGVPLLILNGHTPHILEKALCGEDVGTLFRIGGKTQGAQ